MIKVDSNSSPPLLPVKCVAILQISCKNELVCYVKHN